MKTENFKTEQEKNYDHKLKNLILTHCVTCHQQLDLLRLRLINFEDLIKGIQITIEDTQNMLKSIKSENQKIETNFEPDGKPTQLKKV
jgi:hypothetical protein